MAFMLYSIDEAVDHKYIITKSYRHQAKKGTLIHVMDARENSYGVSVDYRVTKTNQDYTIKFDSVKKFSKWCMPSTFLAKYYDELSFREVVKYIKVEKRSFWSFQLPIILVCLAIIWAASLFFLKGLIGIIVGAAASVAVIVAVLVLSHVTKHQMFERLYEKVSTSR